MSVNLIHGKCEDALKTLSAESVDAVVTDPPYGLSFMGKKWDYDVPAVEIWAECLRVLKPGGHLLAFAGTRTQHRMAVRIEDAGFEIRDMIAWVYGSGFPKSLDVSKAIDKAAGAEREVVGQGTSGKTAIWQENGGMGEYNITAPATDAAREWQGWGTALKPAHEPIVVARKPLIGTVAENVLKYRTGAINVDRCRIATENGKPAWHYPNDPNKKKKGGKCNSENGKNYRFNKINIEYTAPSLGRWPANLIHDGSEEVLAEFPNNVGGKWGKQGQSGHKGFAATLPDAGEKFIGDKGSAARFFYCAKASKHDRDEGLTLPPQNFVQFQTANGTSGKASSLSEGRNTQYRNHHPTVKPTDLMRYLCRLVTPPKGIVLDPFMGSGSTGKAAKLEGFSFVGIEQSKDYFEIAEARISHVEPDLLSVA